MANQSIRAAFERLWQHVTVALGNKADKSEIPNSFSNIKVGSTTIAADSTTDTVELVAGSNLTITPDATNDKITISATNSGTITGVSANGTNVATSGVANIPAATTSKYGVTKLSSSTSSTSTSLAATPSAVKSAYDLANAALPKAGGTMTGKITLDGDPTEDLHAATKKYVDDAAANSGGKFDQHCWLKEGYSYNLYSTSPSWSTQSTAVTLTHPLTATPYITLCTNLTINESNGKVNFSGNVRHLSVGYSLTIDDYGDHIWEISVNDSANQVEDINDLVSLLENYDNDAGYVITGLNEDPSKVSSTDTLSATSSQVAKGTVNIYQMRNEGSSAIGVTSDSVQTGAGTGVYAYYESIELLANALRKLDAPTAGEIVDTYVGVRELLYSADANAYTEGDNGQGLRYTYLGIPSDYLPMSPQSEEGSYKGTGTSSVSIVFNIKPSFIQIFGGMTGVLFPTQGKGVFRVQTGTVGANTTGHKTCDAYNVSISCTENSDGTYKVTWNTYNNNSGTTYYYYALGGTI